MKITIQPLHRPLLTPTVLFSATPEQEQDENNKRGYRRVLSRAFSRLVSLPVRLRTRMTSMVVHFVALEPKLKRRLAIQYLVVALFLGSLLQRAAAPIGSRQAPVSVSYSKFLSMCNDKNVVTQVQIGAERVDFRLDADQALQQGYLPSARKSPLFCTTRKVDASVQLLSQLQENDIPFAAAPPSRLGSTIASIGMLLYFGVLIRFLQSMRNGGGPSTSSPAQTATPSSTTFDDIQGMDGPKQSVLELVDTLRRPELYARLGARPPKGLLLEGPPGTGKTLLARATAATVGVPLLYCNGSDFVEMFVGRGAARVRALFQQAEKQAPCIVFIDELDALGKSRDANPLRQNDEQEQTLNQLLACMDGLAGNTGVIVLAATNRRSVLDPALIRPGRLDRIVTVEVPNAAGREAILRVHATKLTGFQEGTGVDGVGSLGIDGKVDLSAVAAVTEGLSGAELESIVNEAGIHAVRRLQQEEEPNAIIQASDFEASVKNFMETRRPNNAASLLRNVWK